MSVINVKPSGSERSAGGGDSRTMTEVWTVLTDDPADGPLVVQRDPRVPRKGDPHPKDTWLRAGYPDVAPVGKSLTLFRVAVTYERKGDTDNPLLAPARLRRGYIQNTKDCIGKDWDGKPIVNGAGEPFTPLITADAYYPTLTVTRNEERDPQWIQVLVGDGAVNLDPFDGWKPGYALLKPPVADQNRESSVVYWEVTYEIVYNWDGWSPIWRANRGEKEIKWKGGAGPPCKPMAIVDAAGVVVPGLSWLTKAGKADTSGDHVYLDFEIYRKIPFAQFSLVPNRGGGAPITMRKLK